jgi:hypothetical protein
MEPFLDAGPALRTPDSYPALRHVESLSNSKGAETPSSPEVSRRRACAPGLGQDPAQTYSVQVRELHVGREPKALNYSWRWPRLFPDAILTRSTGPPSGFLVNRQRFSRSGYVWIRGCSETGSGAWWLPKPSIGREQEKKYLCFLFFLLRSFSLDHIQSPKNKSS